LYEAQDENGDWRVVNITRSNGDTWEADARYEEGTAHWPKVYEQYIRPTPTPPQEEKEVSEEDANPKSLPGEQEGQWVRQSL